MSTPAQVRHLRRLRAQRLQQLSPSLPVPGATLHGVGGQRSQHLGDVCGSRSSEAGPGPAVQQRTYSALSPTQAPGLGTRTGKAQQALPPPDGPQQQICGRPQKPPPLPAPSGGSCARALQPVRKTAGRGGRREERVELLRALVLRAATAQRVRAIPVPRGSGSGRRSDGRRDGGGSRAAGYEWWQRLPRWLVVASAPSLEDPERGLSRQGFGAAAAAHALLLGAP